MKSLGWALIYYDPSPHKKCKRGHRHRRAHRGDDVETEVAAIPEPSIGTPGPDPTPLTAAGGPTPAPPPAPSPRPPIPLLGAAMGLRPFVMQRWQTNTPVLSYAR